MNVVHFYAIFLILVCVFLPNCGQIPLSEKNIARRKVARMFDLSDFKHTRLLNVSLCKDFPCQLFSQGILFGQFSPLISVPSRNFILAKVYYFNVIFKEHFYKLVIYFIFYCFILYTFFSRGKTKSWHGSEFSQDHHYLQINLQHRTL